MENNGSFFRYLSIIGYMGSPRTIREARRNENYRPVHARVHWQINEQETARRFQYCCAMDETDTVYWIPIGAPRPRTFVGQAKYSINVFGTVWYNHRFRLVFIQGSSNSITYL
ncbi:unnamed protein product [Rotaria magnacalcarata]|uniref:Uncharacterized protein n=1 Tax=Rotaria magnacalcarata TaxID=392030 RepID=A0A816U4H2_9BILA|nr:unnamed protein product [Rotaria magnacalcarata]CAF4451642.1 unnamed protein product [Rotaria magnacalcarata]